VISFAPGILSSITIEWLFTLATCMT
jgi:hypothetical protein